MMLWSIFPKFYKEKNATTGFNFTLNEQTANEIDKDGNKTQT